MATTDYHVLSLNPSNNYATAIKTLLQQHDPDVRVDFPYTVRTHEHRIGMHLRYECVEQDWLRSAGDIAVSIGMRLATDPRSVWRLVEGPEYKPYSRPEWQTLGEVRAYSKVSTQPPPHTYRPRKGVRVQARQIPSPFPLADRHESEDSVLDIVAWANGIGTHKISWGDDLVSWDPGREFRVWVHGPRGCSAGSGSWLVHDADTGWTSLSDRLFQARYRPAS